jgi:uncharacterized protein (TIGR02452 family)
MSHRIRRRKTRPSPLGSAPSNTKHATSPPQARDRIKKLAIMKSRQRHRHMADVATTKARRVRWAHIAQDTQRIVMGDGKYVEKRTWDPSSFSSSALTEPFTEGSAVLPVVRDVGLQIQFSRQGTLFYPHYSKLLANWAHRSQVSEPRSNTVTTIDFTTLSTLACSRTMSQTSPVGVLSFASPKRPGGGYLNGGDEQEERIARSSTLIASLDSHTGSNFYEEHKRFGLEDGSGLHAHSILYSPGVAVIRSDDDDADGMSSHSSHVSMTDRSSLGQYIEPYVINVVSAVPVNAAAIRHKYHVTTSDAQFFEEGIRTATKERLARVLRTFEKHGDRQLVLGAFGCGSSENNAEMVAEIWAELLVTGPSPSGTGQNTGAWFADVFEKVVFALPTKLFDRFKTAFEMRVFEAEVEKAASDDD